jgi:hypothetical protein
MVLSILTGRAYAQSGNAGDTGEMAVQLFDQGLALRKAGQWAEASRRFEDSLRFRAKVGTQLNLALCYEHLGKLVAAWQLYQDAIALAAATADTRRDYAWEQAVALAPRLPRLAVVAPASPPPGLHATRDGTPIDLASGADLHVDPGVHEIVASAPGFQPYRQTVTLREGERTRVVIPALTAMQPPVPRRQVLRPVGITVGAVGVATLAAGLAFAVHANTAESHARALCGERLVCAPDKDAQGQQLTHDAQVSASRATWLLITGVSALAGGAVALLAAPRDGEHAKAELVPVVEVHGAGLAVIGRF